MSTLTQIRSAQIQNATVLEGISYIQILPTAAIRTTQLQDGPKFIQKDGSVAMTAPLVVVDAVGSNQAVSKNQLDLAIANSSTNSTALTKSVSDEVLARTAADLILSGRIDSANTAIAGEQAARLAANVTLQNNIDALHTNGQNGTDTLQTQITTEQTARIAANAAINTAITTLQNENASAATGLQASITGLLATKADLAGNANQVFSVGTATQDSHAVNKAYADSASQGMSPKDPAKVATTGPITLAGLQTIDGVALITGDRVLVKDQANDTENGLYAAVGSSWLRTTDADNTPSAEFTSGLYVYISSGSTYGNSSFTCKSPNSSTYTIAGKPAIQLGTDHIQFVQFSGSSSSFLTGAGLQKNGNTISIASSGVAAGEYRKVTVNALGQVTSGANPSTLSGYGIVDAAPIAGQQTQIFQVANGVATYDAVNKGQLDGAVSDMHTYITTSGNANTTEQTARENADLTIQGNVAQEVLARTAAITNEATTRAANDVILQGNIDAEKALRIAAITTVMNSINSGGTGLSDEVTARAAADKTLQDNIDEANTGLGAESRARTDAVTTLQANIDAEVLARKAAVSSSGGSVADEATARALADTGLQTKIDKVAADLVTETNGRTTGLTDEATARSAQDVILQNNINAVSTSLGSTYATTAQVDARITALIGTAPDALDTLGALAAALASAGGSGIGAITTSIADEVTARTAGDTGLQGKIDLLTTALANEVTRATGAEATSGSGVADEATRAKAAEKANADAVTAEATNRGTAISALTGSNGIERTANDFHLKLAAGGGLTVVDDGLKMSTSIMTLLHYRNRDAFAGVQDGTNKTFNLSVLPLDESETIFLNGILLHPGVGFDYTLTGTTLVFALAPTSSDRITINFIAAA